MAVLDPGLFVRERKRLRQSVVDMAYKTGMTVNRISEIENGADATSVEVAAIASALGVLPSDVAPQGGER